MREMVAFGALLVLALLVLVRALPGRRTRAIGSVAVVVCALGAFAWLAPAHQPPIEEPSVTGRPIQNPIDGYDSSDSCRACHPGNDATWRASYHRTMTQVASAESVLGDFDGVTYRLEEFVYELGRDEDGFTVQITAPPSGYMAYPGQFHRRVVLVTGSHHYQVYWLDTPNGREVEQLPLAWLIEQQRWVPRGSLLLAPPRDFNGVRSGGWNRACIRCHATHGRPRTKPDRTVDSEVGEFGISCEACHGPAGEHARRQREPLTRYRDHLAADNPTDMINPADLTHERSTEVCGQCHGIIELRRSELWQQFLQSGPPFRPGDDLNRDHVPLRPTPQEYEKGTYYQQRFWSDGMVRVVGREFNALLASGCYSRGSISCLSCHELHPDDDRPLHEWNDDQLRVGMRGSAGCLQCHAEYESASSLQAHTHHEPASSGSDCYNCHMPHTIYGLLKASRSHAIDSPGVSVSLQTGRPNACNLCHLDRSLAWTARYLNEWYDEPVPPLNPDERKVAASLLWALRGDAGQRALIAWSMGWPEAVATSGSAWLPPYLTQLMDDPYDAVRYVAARSLRSLPGYAGFEYDFIADQPERLQAIERALQQWRAAPGELDGLDTAAVLLDRSRRHTPDVERLLAQRDHRPVRLTE